MKLSAFMELLLISTHLVKSFHFFASYLLEIDQPQLKNSNCSFIRVVSFHGNLPYLKEFLFPSRIYLFKPKSAEKT